MMNIYLLLLPLMMADWAWGTTNDPNQKSLWQDGKQVGVWKIAEREYLALNGGKFVKSESPIPIDEQTPALPQKPLAGPVEPKRPDGDPEINYGLDLSSVPQEGELFFYNGTKVQKHEAEEILGAMGDAAAKVDPSQLKDDRQSSRLTVVGKGAAKMAASIKIDPRWTELGDGILIADYAAESWHIRDKGYRQLSPDKPTLYLTDAEGRVLYAGESADALFDRLRSRRSPYAITWNSIFAGFNPFTWMMGFSWSSLQVPIEWLALLIVGVLLGCLLLKKTPPEGQAKKI